jgi:hypothetical protein
MVMPSRLSHVLAALPTVTPVGMTALLPIATSRVTVEIKGNSIHPKVNGKDTSVRENRLALTKAFRRRLPGDRRRRATAHAP